MFVNKISSNISKPNFKGFQHETNNVGDPVLRFNYVFDYQSKKAQVELFKVKKNNDAYAGYEVIADQPLASFELKKEGTVVNLKDIPELGKDEAFAYRIVVDGQDPIADSGIKMNDGKFTLVTRTGTAPKVQGASYLAYPDSQRVGVKYRDFNDSNTGEIYIDKNEQKNMENVIRTFSNKTGGNLAGLEYNLDYLANNGYKIQFANPIAGGDNKSSHHYWNKNNFQISDDMGNVENFNSYARKLFQKGIVYVYDGTFTSEGLEGIHFQYALRWADKNPQTYYWFKMQGLKSQSLGLGVVPQNKENLRHRVVNAPVIFDEKTNSYTKNPNYNPNKETFFQIYDASQVTEEQLSRLDKPIENYEKIKSGEMLSINSHDDTLINFVFEVNPQEYIDRLDSFIEFNKSADKPLVLNSPEGTIHLAQFSNFKIDRKTEGGFVAWDANTDIVKMNYHISGYDEKINQSIVDNSERDYDTMMRVRGGYEVQDMTLQAGKYWTKFFKDAQTLYTAQVIKGASNSQKINALIEKGLLPKEAMLEDEAINNVLNGYYNLEPKGLLNRKDATTKALMQLPLDSLEFAENTVGVLSTSFFSNRAINEETLGMSRFELLQKNNPHMTEPYKATYERVNLLFTSDVKEFTDKIIEKLNKISNEKLIDEQGEYTEYGEYVLNLMAPSIAKYAFLKSLTGDKLKTKILPNGEITYDYRDIKENTSLKTLGINGANPLDEAEQLLNLFEKGMKDLNDSDVDYLVNSISKRIDGTNVNSFRLAEAIVSNAGLGLSWRLDAAKDVMDQDAVRNRETAFEDTWENLIVFWKKFVDTVKSENPNSYIVAELTDIWDLFKDTAGEGVYGCEKTPDIGMKYKSVKDAMMKFFNETGITTEAAYSYFFTDVFKIFSSGLEDGSTFNEEERAKKFMWNLQDLINTRGIDFTRNIFTFVGNHDKPRIIHGLALDMKLFHGSLDIFGESGKADFEKNRENRIEAMIQLTNSEDFDSLPLEAKLNVDNPAYFNTVSLYAVAMGKLLRDSINNSLKGVVSDDEIKYLKLALVDLINGNDFGSGITLQIPSINIPELSSFENALRKMLEMAGISLSEKDFNAIIEQANNPELIKEFFIQGDFDWSGENAFLGERNQKIVESILRGSKQDVPSGEWDYMKYSPYTVAITGILNQAFKNVKGENSEITSKFLDSGKKFIKEYDRANVEAHRTELPFEESQKASMAKNGFAVRDIKTATEMLVAQAEYRAHKDGVLKEGQGFSNKENIVLNVWKDATEPAVQKAVMMMSLLSALVGLPTLYGGDEIGMSGYDEKAKNIYLQSRNALPWSELEEGIFKDYRSAVQNAMNGAMNIRTREGVEALNNGTAYAMNTSDDKVPAFMMQNGKGDVTVSVFNTTGIKTNPRFNYFEALNINEKNKDRIFRENNIESINKDNPYVPIQLSRNIEYIELPSGTSLPIGTVFANSDIRDKAKYVVQRIKSTNGLGIVKQGGKISVNGTMVLKKLSFKGNSIQNINKQYNIVSNPYKVQEKAISGEKLSLVSR